MIRKFSKEKKIKLYFFVFDSRTLTEYFQGLFLRDDRKNTLFSIKFFTSIGLGRITYVLNLKSINIKRLFFE